MSIFGRNQSGSAEPQSPFFVGQLIDLDLGFLLARIESLSEDKNEDNRWSADCTALVRIPADTLEFDAPVIVDADGNVTGWNVIYRTATKVISHPVDKEGREEYLGEGDNEMTCSIRFTSIEVEKK